MVLIDLLNQDFGFAVFNDCDWFLRIDECTVYGDRDFCLAFQVSGECFCLPENIIAVRNLFKHRSAAAVRKRFCLQGTILPEETEFDALQRLMSLIFLQDGKPGEIVCHIGLSLNGSVLVDFKGDICRTQFVSFRSQNLSESIIAGDGRKSREITVAAGITAHHDFAFGVFHLNHGMRQVIGTCQVCFGNADVRVRQPVDDRRFDFDLHFFADCVCIPRNMQLMMIPADFPAVRARDLFYIICSRGVASVKADPSAFV